MFCSVVAILSIGGLYIEQEIIPQPKQHITMNISAVIAIISKADKFFIQKRPSKGLLADMWEFPGGKIEKGETKERALKREVKEELKVKVKSLKYAFDVHHFYTQFKVNLSVFFCEVEAFPKTDLTHRWVPLNEMHQYPMPSGSAKILEKLKS